MKHDSQNTYKTLIKIDSLQYVNQYEYWLHIPLYSTYKLQILFFKDTEKFRPPETPANAKNTIRQMLPLGLKESISKGWYLVIGSWKGITVNFMVDYNMNVVSFIKIGILFLQVKGKVIFNKTGHYY